MKKFRIDEITENLDNLRKPLNNIERSKISKHKLYPYYGANNIMDYVDQYIFDEEIICIAEDGGAWGFNEKCSYIVNEKCWVNNHAHVLRAKENLNIQYLSYYLNYSDLNSKITGTTRGKLTKSALNSIEVLLPSLEKQEVIVGVLDKAQELIDKRKAQIEALDELVKSRFIEMFGDPITNSKGLPITTLGEICNMKAGKTIKAKDIYDTFDSKMYPCYGGNGLRGYALTYTHEGNFPLIGRQGALCGNVKYAEGKFYATEHAIVTQPKVPLNTYWLFIMLREMNLNRLASGAAQPGLNVSTLVPLDVIYPSVELQNQFASFAQQVDKLKFEMQESLKELEDNFNSLMQRAFKGELFN
ncbi:restriction endonuclease subunit S [Clostridium butyricum]|uniref:restriction endonuclease subunit S n=1 Tax=Clostridium butyricum TaxID=1492 RepID=UPI0005C1D2DA|nr:restriction endonuclease subunit S [Clostridium butyricum]KIU07777.1 hypothetical protein SC08_Contig83orf01699 [Clostridium butyricum]MBA8967608.1 type I restriction enzyme S subunit [Clostridium butyricum]MBA8971325.1 type I restriction enzyme S subunit [Clostridium butyricum]MBC2429387.1 restriction endonuclease subunit S [Clostridium butyricum]NOW36809.1 type I restriction enzyme S subunit [Clostridium butyricum]